MPIQTYSCALQGARATIVRVEVALARGNYGFTLVGLPRKAVKESWARIFTALKINGYGDLHKKTVVNLAPADIPKQGAGYDLPIALGILAAYGKIDPARMAEYLIVGELALDGGVRSARGVLSMAIEAHIQGFRGMILPEINAAEVAEIRDWEIVPVAHLRDAIAFFQQAPDLERRSSVSTPPLHLPFTSHLNQPDFAEVKGQEGVKRALEIAAAGGHHCVLIGSPGVGKTMLAQRLPGILPTMTQAESFETQQVYAIAGLPGEGAYRPGIRPFRAPHHTITQMALVGGGLPPRPGEISLAHHGVLFLDELTEFSPALLEVLRKPLEDRVSVISGGKSVARFFANFLLVAACNPCPCGYYNHPDKDCVCGPNVVQRYLSKISGPLMDRIDLHIEVTPVPFEALSSREAGESSADIRARVIAARERQLDRFKEHKGIYSNGMMHAALARKICQIDKQGEMLLKIAIQQLDLSARAFDRILKVSRTIADLADSADIQPEHLAEAIQYRSL